MAKLLKNRYAQWILILIVGISIGAIFYPSKTIREEEQQKYERQLDKVTKEHISIVNTLNEKHQSTEKTMKTKITEVSQKINLLTQENHELRQKTDEGTLRIVKPDGTIIEKTFKKTETEQLSQITTEITKEFNSKIKSIENKWKTIHIERVSKIKKDFDKKIELKEKEIFELKRKKTVEINKRSFGVAAGYLSNRNYYTNISYDLFGPVFLDVHTESNLRDDFAVGGGFGLRF